MKHRLINRSTFLLPSSPLTYNEERLREGWLHRMSEAGTKVDKYRGRTDGQDGQTRTDWQTGHGRGHGVEVG